MLASKIRLDRGRVGNEVFCAAGKYIDVRQCERPDDLAQEGRLLVIRFDQCEVNFRSPDFQRQAGEAGSGTYVEDTWGGEALAALVLRTRSGVGTTMNSLFTIL